MIQTWVFIEHEKNEIEDVSLEIIGKLNEIRKRVDVSITSIIFGEDPLDLPEKLIKFGSDNVIFLKNKYFEEYDTENYVSSITSLVEERKPEIILIGATYRGRDFAGRLAARLKTGLAANAITLDIDDKGLLYTGVPGYGGRFIAEIINNRSMPQISTVRPGVFKKMEFNENRNGKIEIIDVNVNEPRVKVKERVKKEFKDISKSDLVVIIGNGVVDKIDLAKKFAELVNADVGVTRPIADRGLAPRDIQIGSTGLSLSSKIAIILGSSGSEHFVSGIEKCGTVISIDINKDSNIFNYSDYCIVEDISKILPLMVEKLEGKK